MMRQSKSGIRESLDPNALSWQPSAMLDAMHQETILDA
jgi:hypothetical protein